MRRKIICLAFWLRKCYDGDDDGLLFLQVKQVRIITSAFLAQADVRRGSPVVQLGASTSVPYCTIWPHVWTIWLHVWTIWLHVWTIWLHLLTIWLHFLTIWLHVWTICPMGPMGPWAHGAQLSDTSQLLQEIGNVCHSQIKNQFQDSEGISASVDELSRLWPAFRSLSQPAFRI